MRKTFAIIAALAATALPQSAWADNVEQAKSNFAVGVSAFERRKFRVAIDAFEVSYRLAPKPAILFSIAQAYKRQYFGNEDGHREADLRQAVLYYRRYVKDEPDGRRVDEANAAIPDLEAVAARSGVDLEAKPPVKDVPAPAARILAGTSAKNATIRVDGGAPVELPSRIEASPGSHKVVIEAQGFLPYERDIILEPGEPYPLDAHLVERPARVTLSTDDDVRVYVDGRIIATTPLLGPIEVPPGAREFAFTRRGYDPVSVPVVLKSGEARRIRSAFFMSRQRVGSFVTFGFAGASLAAGGVMTGLALWRENQALAIAHKQANITPDEKVSYGQATADRGLFRGLAVGGFGIGAALGATAAVLYAIDNPEPPRSAKRPVVDHESPSTEISFDVGPNRCVLSATTLF